MSDKLIKNNKYTALVTGYTSDGDGVCRVDNHVVFVPRTAVGDEIEFVLLKAGKTVSYGKLEKIITPSQARSEERRVGKEC